MISVRLKSSRSIKDLQTQVQGLIKDIKEKTYQTARSLTPVDSGYARSQWKKRDQARGFKVTNATPYIPFLDQGWSRQAPKGITKPTVRTITGYIKTKSRRLKR